MTLDTGHSQLSRYLIYHKKRPKNQRRNRVIHVEILMVFLAIKRVIMCVVIIGLGGLEHRMSRVSPGLRLGHTHTYKVSGTLRYTQEACVPEFKDTTHMCREQDSVWTDSHCRTPAGPISPKAPPSRPSFSIFLLPSLVKFTIPTFSSSDAKCQSFVTKL